METIATEHAGPRETERPREAVVYDSECPICSASADTLRLLDLTGSLELLPLRDPRVAARFPELRLEDLRAEMHVVGAGGDVHRGAEAIRYLSRRLPLLYPLAPLLHIPGSLPLWGRLYRWVAMNRHKLRRHRTE